MFGYIRISKPEMKIKEYDMYKAVYCSLCKKLGRDYGFITRFALNYDFTFTALLELALNDGFEGTSRKACTFNPFKRCTYCNEEEPFAISAAALVILSYNKFIDDIYDEKGIKKLRAYLLKGVFTPAYKKAAKKYPQIDLIGRTYIREQKEAESKENSGLDDAAFPSSKMLSSLLTLCSENENDKKVLAYLGTLLGRYIYLLDCYTDRNEDIKKGAFNPIASLSDEQAKEKIKSQLYIIINEAEKTFELLNIKKFKDILGNIIYVGLEDTMNYEFARMEKKK